MKVCLKVSDLLSLSGRSIKMHCILMYCNYKKERVKRNTSEGLYPRRLETKRNQFGKLLKKIKSHNIHKRCMCNKIIVL